MTWSTLFLDSSYPNMVARTKKKPLFETYRLTRDLTLILVQQYPTRYRTTIFCQKHTADLKKHLTRFPHAGPFGLHSLALEDYLIDFVPRFDAVISLQRIVGNQRCPVGRVERIDAGVVHVGRRIIRSVHLVLHAMPHRRVNQQTNE